MGSRRQGRELALQCLYQLQYASPDPAARMEGIGAFFANPERTGADARAIAYGETLVRGVSTHQPVLEAAIAANLKGWTLDRLTAIDGTILKIAVFELKFGNVPREVAIDEALEIARRFSSGESVRFINGILDAIARSEGGTLPEPPGTKT